MRLLNFHRHQTLTKALLTMNNPLLFMAIMVLLAFESGAQQCVDESLINPDAICLTVWTRFAVAMA